MTGNRYCIIMAGGIGSRFWPLSRVGKPKQFIDILNIGYTLLQLTYNRFLRVVPAQNIYVITSAEHASLVRQQLPALPQSNVLTEPMRRNTAPCIAYANWFINRIDPNALTIVTPADHIIGDEEKFMEVMENSLRFVNETNALLTLGLKPQRPETGYGYIQIEADPFAQEKIHQVKTFTEKPNSELAKAFVESGEYFWNSGIFIWSLYSIQEAFKNYLPTMHHAFGELNYNTETDVFRNQLQAVYQACINISIDYGVLEQAENVFVYCTEFGWADLGTWGSLYEYKKSGNQQNIINSGNMLLYNSTGNFITADNSQEKLIVIKGLENFIVVDTNDVLLIYPKGEEQELREIVNDIKISKGEKWM